MGESTTHTFRNRKKQKQKGPVGAFYLFIYFFPSKGLLCKRYVAHSYEQNSPHRMPSVHRSSWRDRSPNKDYRPSSTHLCMDTCFNFTPDVAQCGTMYSLANAGGIVPEATA
jgi:hypothetical protein